MTTLLLFLAAAAAPPPMRIAPAEAQAFLQRLYTRHGRVGTERIVAWTGDACATELRTATRTWRIDWTKGRAPAAIEVNKGNRIGTPLAGDAGFLADAAGAPVATISIVTPNSMKAIKASFVVEGLVAACRRR